MSGVAAMEAEFATLRVADDADGWALAAYRLAVARSELATRPEELEEALSLLQRAGRILTPDRAPLEHSRILTAAASCHRAAGQPDQALELFGQAAELALPRAPAPERAAALVNVGLIQAEAGRPLEAITALDTAVGLLETSGDDEGSRLLGAALINRAQARQVLGDDPALADATSDYERALEVLAPESPQAGMAAHGLGAVLLERSRRDPANNPVEPAIAAFERSLGTFGASSHPLQHAIAKHSLALAYEQRGEAGDLVRAVSAVEASLAIFDPRLHQDQWRTAAETLGRLERALDEAHGPRSRMAHTVSLMASTTADERRELLRERLRRVATQPLPRLESELDSLTHAMCERPI
ncbi:MAG: tetratricopeptide repeat protein, partial [Microthrixaceae bacterium]